MNGNARRGLLPAILRKRCPRCREGAIFRGLFAMNETCGVCGLRFGRGQPGYFMGAMYVSYGSAIPLIALLTLVEYQFLPGWSLWQLVLLAWALCVPLVPWLWQYSRVVWMYFDQSIDPTTDADADGPAATPG